MIKPKALIPLLLLLGVFNATPAQADQVIFHNGDRLSGAIISMRDTRTLYFRSNIAGDMRIDRGNVAELYDDNLDIVPIPQAPPSLTSPLTGIENSGDNRSVQTWTQTATGDVAPAEPIAPSISGETAEALDEGNNFEWSGRANLGGRLDDGNSRSKALTFDANIQARDDNNRFNVGGKANWQEEEGDETDNNQLAFASYDHFLSEKYFIGGKLQFQRDKFQNLDLRSRVGLYNGYQFFERDDLNLQVRAGGEYIHEKFSNDTTEGEIAASWGLDYDQKFFEGAFQIFHKHGLAVPVSATDAFLFDSESGVRVPVGKHLTGTAQVDFDWDNDPAPGIGEDDTSYSLKLGYEW